jgi:hypothetical protein
MNKPSISHSTTQKLYSIIIACITYLTLPSFGLAETEITSLKDRDLAIIIPKDFAHSFPAFKNKKKWGVFESHIFTDVANSFLDTDVENALTVENSEDEWAVVSARVSPCSALFPNLRTSATLCWPELRLVLQPILKRPISYQSTKQKFFADDRNIHALYHISPYSILTDADAKIAENYIAMIKKGESLTEIQFNEFTKLRNTVSSNFLLETLDLRVTGVKAPKYDNFDIRPEYYKDWSTEIFTKRFTSYLKRHAFYDRLHAATAFSLPAGRMPTHSDIWVFKKYKRRGQHLVESSITLHHKNGRMMLNTGKTNTSSMQFDDPIFTSDNLDERVKRMVSHHVVLNRQTQRGLLTRIADPKLFLVEHTSCASCHKLNPNMPANFHALSYFINETSPTVTQRVILDVKENLEWVKNNL